MTKNPDTPTAVVPKVVKIEKKLRKAFSKLNDKKAYSALKEGSPQLKTCEAINLYLKGFYEAGCIKLYELLNLSKPSVENDEYRRKVKELLYNLKNPQGTLFTTYKK